jgi:tetratricopeptide (TPR) repeat protein
VTRRKGAPPTEPAPTVADEAVYSLRGIQQMLGLSRDAVLGFVEAGFVAPTRGPRNAYRFAFQDVVLLRTAQTLRAAHIPTRRILRALRRLRDALPPAAPLTGLRITAIGDDVAVREAGQDVALESGQLLFDFQVAAVGDVLTFGPRAQTRAAAGSEPDGPTGAGEPGDAESAESAEDACRRAIARRPDDPDAYLALGGLLYEQGRFAEALAVYDRALVAANEAPEVHYNRGIVLEDLGRFDDALDAYRSALRLDEAFADAHWNAARLYEQQAMPREALRHFNAYRRLRR